MKIIQNRAIDSYRRATSRPSPAIGDKEAAEGDDATDVTLDQAIGHRENEELIELMKRLPEAQVEVIVLAFFGELSHSEIAVQLDLPVGTVKGRMRLGLEKLRRQMAEPAEESPAGAGLPRNG